MTRLVKRINKVNHRKSTLFIVLLLWMLMWIISGWNTQNADYENYVIYYNRNFVGFSFFDFADPGFNFINKLFNNWGISFELYHIIIYGVIITFICNQVWKRSYSPILVLLIYIFTAYFADIIQLRNYIALLLTMLGLFALVDKKEKSPKTKFFICNLLASTIHITFIFYFIFLFVDVKIKSLYLISVCIICSILGHPILNQISSIAYIAENSFLTNRVETYMANTSFWSVIICSCQYLFHYFVCKHCMLNYSDRNSIFDSYRFMQINVLLSVLLVMTSVNMTVFRLFRNILLFSSIYIVNGYLSNQKKSIFLLILYFSVMSFFHLWWGEVLPNVRIIISNNLLWK